MTGTAGRITEALADLYTIEDELGQGCRERYGQLVLSKQIQNSRNLRSDPRAV